MHPAQNWPRRRPRTEIPTEPQLHDHDYDPDAPRPLNRTPDTEFDREDPRYVRPEEVRYRGYTDRVRHLRRITKVVPALVERGLVSIDRVSDHTHYFIEARTLEGKTACLLVSRSGWLPLEKLEAEHRGLDRSRRSVTFSYRTTAIYTTLRALSQDDRKHIVAAVLEATMGKKDR